MRGKAPEPDPEDASGGPPNWEDLAQGEPETEVKMEFCKNRFEHVLMMLSSFLDPFIFFGELTGQRQARLSDIGYYASTMLVAMPIIYIQIFIGQYTQMNCLQYGKMIPLLYGLGISKLLMNFYTVLQDAVNSGVLGHYMYQTFKAPWISCEFTSKKCYTFDDLANCPMMQCWMVTMHEFSSYIYYRKINESVQWDKTIFVLSFYMIAFVIVALGHTYIRYVLSLGVIFLTVITIILITVTLSISESTKLQFNYDAVPYVTVRSFLTSLRSPLLAMNLASAGIITYGTHLPLRMSASIQSFIICIIFIFSIFIGAFFFGLCLAPILNVTTWRGYEMRPAGKLMLFVYIEEYLLTHLKNPTFPVFLNGRCLAVILSKQIAHLHIIGENITSCFPSLLRFRIYVLGGITLAKIICVIPYYVSTKVVEETMNTAINLSSLIILEFEVISVIYIYTYTALSDDIHYTVGSQPARLWKLLWLVNPIIITVAMFSYIYLPDNKITTPVIFVVLVTILPIIIGGTYKLIELTRSHNMAGFFMSEENWGPRNSKERKLRHMYNPREATHSRRKEESCNHECLIESKILKTVITDEEKIKMARKLNSPPTGSHTINNSSSESSVEEADDRKILHSKFKELKREQTNLDE